MEEITAQVLPLAVAALALLVALGKAWVGRVEARNQQDTTAAQVSLLRQEIETMREKSDIATRELVNDIMQQYRAENRELQERVPQSDTERAALQAELDALRQRLEETETQLRQRINELEAIIQEKDARIAELEKRLVRHN